MVLRDANHGPRVGERRNQRAGDYARDVVVNDDGGRAGGDGSDGLFGKAAHATNDQGHLAVRIREIRIAAGWNS